jgi:hypothetical protein
MPLTIACPSCSKALKVGDHLVGKKVKCPNCSQAVPVGQPKAAAAQASAPPKSAAGSGGAEGMISVTCAACKKKLNAKAALAGKAVKCPGCGQPVRIPTAAHAPVSAPAPEPPPPAPEPPPEPAPAAPSAAADEDEWTDVNEAAAPPPEAPAAAATGEKGLELLEPFELPKEMMEHITSGLTRNERILWADRPQMDILIHQAGQRRKAGIIMMAVAPLVFVGLGVLFWLLAKTIIPLIVLSVVALLPVAGGVYVLGEPQRQLKNGPKRGCYMLTNRRVVIHPGLVMSTTFGTSRNAVLMASGGSKGKLFSYAGLELGGMSRREDAKFEGCGSLNFARDLFDRPAGIGLGALKDVREVEKKIRQQLVDPLIDKLLRGEKLTKDEKGEKSEAGKKAEEEGDVIEPDENIKDFVRGGKKPPAADDEEDPNVKGRGSKDEDEDKDEDDLNTKTRGSSVERSVEEAEDEHREAVEAELTEGEKVLWIGTPEGKTKGRGILGAVTGAAHRYEPDYYLYAITNRRAMLFCKKGSKDSQAAVFGGSKDTQGPVTYYPSQLQGCSLEEDKRVPNGGNIVFRKVKRIIKTTTTSKDARTGRTMSRTSTRVEMHHFGLLRVRSYLPVARLLYDTLIAPVRDR